MHQEAAHQAGAQGSSPGEDTVDVAAPDQDAVAVVKDRLRRVLADLDNLRKRYARELERQREAEVSRVAGAWLPVLDNLDRALSHADTDPSAIIEGVRAVRDQALAVLASLGFSRYDEVGVPFDPARHEVVNVVDDPEAEPGTVVQVLRPGYGTAERQLRPGAVTVAARRG
ncbi:MAG: nucleotide exchange factor GrpE [Pseudonocardiales bacterium]|nr:nucleotide exchange factor GrpE [Pseudonocardiales bacterium]